MRRTLFALAVASVAASACTHDVVIDELVDVAELKAVPNRDLDILFVIDNSPSMGDKQASLVANFPRLIDQLALLDGGLPNLHIGVITSDMGTSSASGQSPIGAIDAGQQGGCAGKGDDGRLRSPTPNLQGDLFLSDLATAAGGRDRNYPGELRDAFTALATVGETGCGFEQHLRAMERSFSNPENAGFIRPTANLAVVIVADEDDCSMRDGAMLGGGDSDPALGPLESYRCTRFGVQCDPDDPSHPHSELHGCVPRADSPYVEDVQPFIDFLTGLKADPRMVMVAAIAGDPTQVATELRAASPGAPPRVALAHACAFSEPDGSLAVADPAIRIAAFVAAFRGRASFTSICDADLSNPLTTIGARARGLMGEPCLGGPLADTSPDPGVQPACEVFDIRDSDPDHPTSVPPCGYTYGDCYELATDAAACPRSPDHLRITVSRPNGAAADAWTQVSCQPRR